MAVVQGVKERVHLPIYDCLTVEKEAQLRDSEPSSILKFFVNVQKKTKLETNLQSAGLLPHYNTFEARALRVVVSDLPPVFPADPTAADDGLEVTATDPADGKDKRLVFDTGTQAVAFEVSPLPANNVLVEADLELGLDQVMKLLRQAQQDPDRIATLAADDDGVTLKGGANDLPQGAVDAAAGLGAEIALTVDDLEGLLDDIDSEKKGARPPDEQIHADDRTTSIIGKLLYNTVTSLYVGEKQMISMPTWFFPSGAGPYSEGSRFTTNGEPNPMATFRLAEPVFVDRNQNFRVEIEIPDTDVLKEIQRIYGPLFIWVVLDGYMTRDVQ